MLLLSNDILETIILKLHRFNYLYNLLLTNKKYKIISNYIINKHCNNILYTYLNLNKDKNKYNKENYILISRYLYNYKIINLKKINNNIIPNININSFVLQLILYNYYFDIKCNIHIHIINFNTFLIYMKKNILYYPFIIIYLQIGYIAYIEISKNLFDIYRIKLSNNTNNISLYQCITEKEILELLNEKNKLLLFNKILKKFYMSYLCNDKILY